MQTEVPLNGELIKLPEPELPTVQNNALSFSGSDAFSGFMRQIWTFPDYELDEYMNMKFGFKSLNKTQNESKLKSATEEDVPDDSMYVDDPYFASILNEDGVVEIGGIVYDVDKEYVYIYKNWAAYEVAQTSSAKTKLASKSKGLQANIARIEPCSELQEPQPIDDSMYRVRIIEPCDPPPSGGTGGDSDGGVTDYPSEKIVTYLSGGRDGRLKGKSWNVNYYIYSSVGAKSVHARKYTFAGVWWRVPANKISLDSRISYQYGESSIDRYTLKATLSYDIGVFLVSAVDNIFNKALSLPTNGKLYDTLIDQLSGIKYKVTIFKKSWDSYDLDVLTYRKTYSKSKIEAKTVSKVFDWSTSPDLINYPPRPPSGKAVKFKTHLLESTHTLTHDGHYIEFKTDKRK